MALVLKCFRSSVQTLSYTKNDLQGKAKIVVPVAPTKIRSTAEKLALASQANLSNVLKQITISSDQLIPGQVQVIQDQQNLQMQIQQQLQQQILQHKRQQQNQTLQQQINAIVNLKAQVQEHLQMRQANVVNGVISQNAPQYTSLLHKKENINVNAPSTSQVRIFGR
jgi:hypothetical protein